MKSVEWSKVKHTQSGHALRHPFEHTNINNENQNCKTGTVYVLGDGLLAVGWRVKEGD
jgi:hypothetical protein